MLLAADVHKRTHTFVAVDEVGRKLGEKVVAATTQVIKARSAGRGSGSVSRWCGRLRIAGTCRPGWNVICWPAGQKVVRVPPKMMAQTRASARTRGKSDPIDALAVARAFLREPDLPVASSR